jgi:polyphosphate:AMP phosphotransferase
VRVESGRVSKEDYERRLPNLRDELLSAQLQARQLAKFSAVLIVTGVPAAGRSETVNELLEWLDPKYITVRAFGEPDREERQRPPMWRYWRALPARGRIAVFFAGWYSEYFANASHGSKARRRHEREVERIRRLEAMLVADGVRVIKIHLSTDAKTQRRRLAKLRADKLTRWRVTREDRWLARHHASVERATAECIRRTDHPAARWRLIDGTDEHFRLLRVAEILRDELQAGLRQAARKTKPAAARTAGRQRVRAKPLPHVSENEYEVALESLQGRLALLARRPRFQKHAMVLVFEGMDAAGKGGAIRRVTHALDVRQYQVVPVSAPTPQELAYPYLWRFWQHVPKPGTIAIFDRSWYGRVLVERVRGFAAAPQWRRAYDEICEFERELTEQGIIVAKFWLHVGKAEQLRRFHARDEDPLKRFKVDKEDWINRDHYGGYQHAAAEMIRRTDTKQARWTALIADDKESTRLKVLETICATVEAAL